MIPCISRRRSGAGISLYKLNKEQSSFTKLELGPELRYDPFLGFTLNPTIALFNESTTVRLVCKFDTDLKDFPGIANRTLLQVNLNLKSGRCSWQQITSKDSL